MFLLDTNVVSDLRKVKSGNVDPDFREWASNLQIHQAYISVMTIFEIEMGIAKKERKDAVQGAILRDWFENKVRPTFKDRVLPITSEISTCAANLHVPDPKSDRDAFIAATGLEHGLIVVTRNIDDFINMQVGLFNPYTGVGRKYIRTLD